MHYCVHLLTKELPTEDQIADILQPYNSEAIYENVTDDTQVNDIKYPTFTWDWYEIGGRYKSRIKLKVDIDDKTYNWKWRERNPRNGRLFLSGTLSILQEHITPSFIYHEEDWFSTLGYFDGYIRVDGAKQKDILNLKDLGCYACILPDGSAIARSSWNGKHFIDDEHFDEKYIEALENNMDGFITILDIHN